MTTTRTHKVFVNLPVRDLPRAMGFFQKLGFAFNPKFTDDKAACMVLSEEGYVMLLREEFFKTFTRRPVGDFAERTSAIVAFSVDSREAVDEVAAKAAAAGASPAMDPQDHGFMYLKSFHDLDGHHWEVFWMDPAAAQG
ncbi:MAG: VOC family protein [Polyangiales bacterium]